MMHDDDANEEQSDEGMNDVDCSDGPNLAVRHGLGKRTGGVKNPYRDGVM